MGNVAAVDIGTNSVRLLVTDPSGAELVRLMRITRLGQGVDATGRLAPEAIERSLAVLREYAKEIGGHDVIAVRATATSAARDAENAHDFVAPATDILGVSPQVITGDEEATLSFAGATTGVAPADGPFMVVDIGGGSTEFIVGTTEPEGMISVPMGCVRMSERYLHDDPPTRAELEAAAEAIDAILDTVAGAVPADRARRIIGVAGTVTTVAAYALGLTAYDPAATHHSTIAADRIDEILGELAAVPAAERATMILEPERADVIVAGTLVLQRVMRRFTTEPVLVSEHDILDGIAAAVRARTEGAGPG